MDDRLMRIFCGEVATQCTFVIYGAELLDQAMERDDELGRAIATVARESRTMPKMTRENADELVAAKRDQHERMAALSAQRPPVQHRGMQTWFALQGILISAANLSKLLWGGKDRQPLRDLLAVDDTSAIHPKRHVRNAFEHYDERIDLWHERGAGNFVSRNLAQAERIGGGFVDEPDPPLFGNYDQGAGILSFWDKDSPEQHLALSVPDIVREARRILALIAD